DVPADGAEVPAAGAADGDGAKVLFAEPADGGGAGEPAAAVTLAAWLEPKMADTIPPKTLILSSCLLRPATRQPERSFCTFKGPLQVKGAPRSYLESRQRGVLSQLDLTYSMFSVVFMHFNLRISQHR